MHILVDYFHTTFEFRYHEDQSEIELIENYINEIIKFLNVQPEEVDSQNFGKGRYKYKYMLGSYIYLYMIGPNNAHGNPTCSLELRGDGCRDYEWRNKDKNWYDFLTYFVLLMESMPTRIDLTIDDFDGTLVSFDYVKSKLDSKMFTTTFAEKDYTLIGSKTRGYSINFGSHSSSQMLCIYDKKKESEGNKEVVLENYWIRYEMRFMDKAREVCYDLIDAYEGVIKHPEMRDVPKGYEGFKEYILGIFHNMLDLKEDNNYDANNLYKANTDSKWLEFLSFIPKAKISPKPPKTRRWSKFEGYVKEMVGTYHLVKWMRASYNHEQLYKEVLQDMCNQLHKITEDKAKLSKLNTYLSDNELEPVKMSDIDSLKNQVDERLLEEELPF